MNKKTDQHKKIALKMQQQADSLTANLVSIRRLGEEIDNKQLIEACDRGTIEITKL